MVELIYPPDPQTLLPPILAFLPTAFASSRPPPDFLPLLSPILRQRLQLNTDASENWLRQLCWDRSKSERLKDQVEEATFEPHPVSGEIEVGDVEPIAYKRLDEETLRAQLKLVDWPFTPIFVWCTGNDHGHGWKLSEVLPSPETDPSWSASIAHANETSSERNLNEALVAAGAASARPASNLSVPQNDEDDYWAQYDQTPGRTPARKPSVTPGHANASEADYYARYGEVQPAMDNHDPDEEMEDGVDQGLNGHSYYNHDGLAQITTMASNSTGAATEPPPYQENTLGNLNDTEKDDTEETEVRQPIPTSPSSRGGSDTVARLEDTAERFSLHNSASASEMGIRQHISTSIKSMYRLAKSAGMDREEFERMVARELETLSIFDNDD